MTLGQALELLRQFSTVPISVDVDALEELGVTLHESVHVKLANATVGKTLEAILGPTRLTYVVEDAQV